MYYKIIKKKSVYHVWSRFPGKLQEDLDLIQKYDKQYKHFDMSSTINHHRLYEHKFSLIKEYDLDKHHCLLLDYNGYMILISDSEVEKIEVLPDNLFTLE